MAKSVNEQSILKAVVGLVRGVSNEELEALIVKGGTPRDDAGMVLDEARKRIQLAADYNRDEHLGLAIKRLTRIIELSLPGDPDDPKLEDLVETDLSVAIRSEIELNKLLKLHEVQSGNAGGDEDTPATDRADELGLVRKHLAPMFDVADDYPVSELARMAAERIRVDGGEDPAG